MKRSFLLVSLVAVALAGVACAGTPPGTVSEKSAAAYADQASTPDTDQDEAVPAEDQAGAVSGQPRRELRKPRTNFGATVGIYSPVSSRVGDVFGDDWTRCGLRPLPVLIPGYWRPAFDVGYYSMSRADLAGFENKVRLIPITAGVLRGFGEEGKLQTYVALNAGPFYADVHAPSIGLDKSGWGLDANATVGLIFEDRYFVEARYDFMSKFGGLDFSALSISAGVKLFSARL